MLSRPPFPPRSKLVFSPDLQCTGEIIITVLQLKPRSSGRHSRTLTSRPINFATLNTQPTLGTRDTAARSRLVQKKGIAPSDSCPPRPHPLPTQA